MSLAGADEQSQNDQLNEPEDHSVGCEQREPMNSDIIIVYISLQSMA